MSDPCRPPNIASYQYDPNYLLAERVVVSFVTIVATILISSLFVISVLTKNDFPMRFRSFPLSTVLFVGCSIENFFSLLSEYGIIPCEYHRMEEIFVFVINVTVVQLYVFRVYYQTRIMQGSLEDLPSFFRQSQVFNSNWFHFLYLFIHFFFYFGSWLLLCYLPSTTYPQLVYNCKFPCTGSGAPWSPYWVGVFMAEFVVIFSWLGTVSYRSMKGVADTLYFKRDLKHLLILSGTFMILYIIVTVAEEPLVTDIVRVAADTFLWIILAGIPSLHTYFSKSERQPISPSDLSTTLFKILCSEVRKDFTNFLKSEWTLENLLFYDEAEKFKANPNLGLAQKIYETYIKPGSLRQVNLDGEIVNEIAESLELQAIDKELFQKAEDNAIKFMTLDSLPRFMKHQGWKESPENSSPQDNTDYEKSLGMDLIEEKKQTEESNEK